MKSFAEFISEGGYHVPVVSLSKEKVDLEKFETRNEINRNLAAELSREWVNPYGGWRKVSKVLSMYSIALPNIIFQDAEEGEEVVAISQFGEISGAELNGNVSAPHQPEESEWFLYYSYGIGESGFYEANAIVTDEQGLDDIISDQDDVDYEGPEGQLDPRQP